MQRNNTMYDKEWENTNRRTRVRTEQKEFFAFLLVSDKQLLLLLTSEAATAATVAFLFFNFSQSWRDRLARYKPRKFIGGQITWQKEGWIWNDAYFWYHIMLLCWLQNAFCTFLPAANFDEGFFFVVVAFLAVSASVWRSYHKLEQIHKYVFIFIPLKRS